MRRSTLFVIERLRTGCFYRERTHEGLLSEHNNIILYYTLYALCADDHVITFTEQMMNCDSCNFFCFLSLKNISSLKGKKLNSDEKFKGEVKQRFNAQGE